MGTTGKRNKLCVRACAYAASRPARSGYNTSNDDVPNSNTCGGTANATHNLVALLPNKNPKRDGRPSPPTPSSSSSSSSSASSTAPSTPPQIRTHTHTQTNAHAHRVDGRHSAEKPHHQPTLACTRAEENVNDVDDITERNSPAIQLNKPMRPCIYMHTHALHTCTTMFNKLRTSEPSRRLLKKYFQEP